MKVARKIELEKRWGGHPGGYMIHMVSKSGRAARWHHASWCPQWVQQAGLPGDAPDGVTPLAGGGAVCLQLIQSLDTIATPPDGLISSHHSKEEGDHTGVPPLHDTIWYHT